jgi:inner membrane protein
MEFSTISPQAIWTLCGIILFFLELLIPGFVVAFFGIGAVITALTTWMGITPSFAAQMGVFLVSSILMLFVARKFVKKVFVGKENESNDEYNFKVEIGKIVPVIELIQPNEVGGKVRYQGAPWSAISKEPIAPGESVKIVGFDNLTLIVQKTDGSETEK